MEAELIENLDEGQWHSGNFFAQAERVYEGSLKRQTSRPESTGRRPSSGKTGVKMAATKQEGEATLEGFYKFLQFHYIKISDVWKTKTVEVSPQGFRSMVGDLGYELSARELDKLMQLLSNSAGKVCLRKMTQLPVWSKCEQEIMDIIDKSTIRLVNDSKLARSNQQKERERDVRRRRSKRFEELYSSDKKPGATASTLMATRSFPLQESQTAAALSCTREILQDRLLQQKISRNESEYKFEVLVKMGQANNILKKLNRNARFEVCNKNDAPCSRMRIVEVEDGMTRVLSQNDFTRRLKHLQRKEKEQQNLKVWESSMNGSHKTNFKGTLLLMLEEKDELKKDTLNQRIGQRDKQLKVILLETLRLKLILKEQLDTLQAKRINHPGK